MLIPALDVYNKKCVRLKKGKFNKKYVFCKNPIKILLFYLNKKVKRIHIIDLNGAKNKSNINKNIITNIIFICNYYKISKIQKGGGLRENLKIKIFSIFCYKIILSTYFFKKTLKLSKKTIISLDIKNKFIYSKGWKKKELSIKEFFFKFKPNEIIYTNISLDGTLKGVNFNKIKFLLKFYSSKLIISGGVKNKKDLMVYKYDNILGYISGKAVYRKKISLKYAM
ncbi:1-(5-phosphoribosyl)-5-[(5-phosphoribosylamino)methylideneamino]imidazole-4-carboxamide isomerase [Candidatus Vidania fulgoroideorum]